MAGGWRWAMTSARKRLSSGVGIGASALGDRERLGQEPLDVAAGLGRGREHARALSQLLVDPRAFAIELRGAHAPSRPQRVAAPPVTSHLFRTSAVAQLDFIASSATRRSWAVTPSWASQTTSATSALGRLLGAQARVVLDRLLDLRGAPDAGGVDEDQLATLDLDRRVDRVAGGAGDFGDDHAVVAEEGVDQGRLADIRPADHREPDDVLFVCPAFVVGGQQFDETVEQVAGAEALGGGDAHRLAEPEAVEVVRERDRFGPSILLAATTIGRLPRRRMSAISWSPGRRPARASTTSSATCASASAALAWSWIETASGSSSSRSTPPGVDQREVAAVPVGRELLAVARDARSFVHDRFAALGEAVDEGRFADVRIADDGDLHASRFPRLVDEGDDLVDDVVERELGGVERDRAPPAPRA